MSYVYVGGRILYIRVSDSYIVRERDAFSFMYRHVLVERVIKTHHPDVHSFMKSTKKTFIYVRCIVLKELYHMELRSVWLYITIYAARENLPSRKVLWSSFCIQYEAKEQTSTLLPPQNFLHCSVYTYICTLFIYIHFIYESMSICVVMFDVILWCAQSSYNKTTQTQPSHK